MGRTLFVHIIIILVKAVLRQAILRLVTRSDGFPPLPLPLPLPLHDHRIARLASSVSRSITSTCRQARHSLDPRVPIALISTIPQIVSLVPLVPLAHLQRRLVCTFEFLACILELYPGERTDALQFVLVKDVFARMAYGNASSDP